MFERLGEKLHLSAIPQIFFSAAAFVILFVLVAVPLHEQFADFFGAIGGFTFRYFGWFYVATVSSLLIFLVWVAFSRFGGMKLGKDDEEPEYSSTTWFAMLFAAGIGTILMFWGVAEPLSHFANPPLEGIEPQTIDAAKHAMNVALYHFALHTWTIFTLPALAISYFTYRKNLPMRISSIFYSVLGERVFGPIGWAIDVVALVGTLFGVAVSVGLGTLQLNSGLNHVLGVPVGAASQIVIIAVITIIATISVALGLDKGIKRLSEFNIGIALFVMLFIWICGPTLFITSGIVQNFGNYMQNLPWMAFWTEAYQGTSWQQSWTVFYWAWTIAWAPYVGIFIARISRGRTIRQFVIGSLGAPSLFSLVWFTVFGLAAMDLELNLGVDLVTQVQADVSIALFEFLSNYPMATLMSLLGLVVIVIFLTTSADSAALVVDQLSRSDLQVSKTGQRVFWTFMLGSVAGTLMLGGGLPALQNVITALGFPFCVLLVFMAWAMKRSLQKDYDEERLMAEETAEEARINQTR